MFPMVITAANSVASGRTVGISVNDAYIISSMMTLIPSPFPTSSSIYRQINCKTKTNRTMKNERTIGPTYDFRISLCTVFISLPDKFTQR